MGTKIIGTKRDNNKLSKLRITSECQVKVNNNVAIVTAFNRNKWSNHMFATWENAFPQRVSKPNAYEDDHST